MKSIEVLFTPAEYSVLPQRDLRETVCVVFDILRATSTIVTALASGAASVVPVLEISEALAWRTRQPGVLLAGEREGVRIRATGAGEADFDLGNSPREFTPAAVNGKTIVITTTNGTRALRAGAGASQVLVGSFLNLAATARQVMRAPSGPLLLICSGTREQAAFEDTLAAGALCELLLRERAEATVSDSALIACELFRRNREDLLGAMRFSANGRRLLAMPELAADLPACVKCDVYDFACAQDKSGHVKKVR